MRLIKDDLDILHGAGLGITINKNFDEVKKNIKHVACEIRKSIRTKLADRFFSAMLDIASKNNRSVIGINAQYIDGGEVQTPSLGIIALEKRHTADYILKMVEDCLQVYRVSRNQITAFTTDNASAMIAMVKQFDENVFEFTELNIHDDEYIRDDDMDIPNMNNDLPLSEDAIQSVMRAVADIEALNNVLNDQHNYEDLFEEIIGETSKNTTIISTIRCGAHSIQLIVRQGIKNSNFKQLLVLCKYVAKKLRTEKYKIIAREADVPYSIPHISNETRWDSDYMMVCM